MTYDIKTSGASNASPVSIPRIQSIGSNKPNACAIIRVMEVENAAIALIVGDAKPRGPWKPEGGRLVAALARHAWERQRHTVSHMRGRAWGFPVFADELEGIARIEAAFGAGHTQAERELERFDALPSQPFVDEVTAGLLRAVAWMDDPANFACFDARQGEGAR